VWQLLPSGAVAVIQGSMFWPQFSAIFSTFRQKTGLFPKTNVMLKILQKPAVHSFSKNHLFAKFFGENIFKIITSVPGLQKK
jgi:hypothetical protein